MTVLIEAASFGGLTFNGSKSLCETDFNNLSQPPALIRRLVRAAACVRRERPCGRRAAEQRDELAPV
jgi:hypothetical protein